MTGRTSSQSQRRLAWGARFSVGRVGLKTERACVAAESGGCRSRGACVLRLVVARLACAWGTLGAVGGVLRMLKLFDDLDGLLRDLGRAVDRVRDPVG